jgi:S-formylglutathione hydrolase FrmB
VGDRYGLFEGNRRLHEILQSRGVAHEFALPPGDHGYDYVREVLPKSLAFVARQWR